MKKIIGIIILTLAAVALVGYNSLGADIGTPVHITIKAGEMRYSPLSLHLKAGVPVHLELRNEGKVMHDLNIPGLASNAAEVPGHAAHQHHGQGTHQLHVAAEPGKSAVCRFEYFGSFSWPVHV